ARDAEHHFDAIGFEQIDQDFSDGLRAHARRSFGRVDRAASTAMRRQASSMASSGTVRLRRMKLPASSPKDEPGMTATASSCRSAQAKSSPLMPVPETSTTMNMPASGGN